MLPQAIVLPQAVLLQPLFPDLSFIFCYHNFDMWRVEGIACFSGPNQRYVSCSGWACVVPLAVLIRWNTLPRASRGDACVAPKQAILKGYVIRIHSVYGNASRQLGKVFYVSSLGYKFAEGVI
ncbi:MAG: hypothetical protein WCP58_05530 [bacterium]